MKVVKTGKRYINYGLIPQNEYATANSEKNTTAATILEPEPKPDDVAYKLRLSNQQALHPSGRRNVRGWTHLWKVNGWRAEAALQDGELTDMGKHSDDVRKNNRPL